MTSNRRPLARLLVTIVLLWGTLTETRAAGQPADWTQFRVDGMRNAVIDGTLSTTWKIVSGGPISSSPVLSGSTLYVGNNHGDLYAIDVSTGRTLWMRHFSNDLMSQPLLYKGLVIVGEGNEESTGAAPAPVYVGSGPSALVALDAATGATRWTHAVAGSAMPTGAIINGTLVHHNGAGWVAAIDAQTGTLRYTRNVKSIASMTAATPIGSDRFVTIGVLENAAFSIKVSDGSIVWKTTFPSNGSGHGDCPPVTDGKILICNYLMPEGGAAYTTIGGRGVQHAYALDTSTGKVLWDVEYPQHGVIPPRNEAAIPLLHDGVVYFGSAIIPYMHAVDERTGKLLWERKISGVVKGGIVYDAGRIYFGDLRGDLLSLDAKTGAVVGSKRMPSGFNVGSPIVVGKTLIIGSRTGSIYALPLAQIDAAKDNS